MKPLEQADANDRHKEVRDLFSSQASSYAQFRPAYPAALIEYLLPFTDARDAAWDCATGNGQAAQLLADYFQQVEASDISEAQLQKAIQKPNIHYTLCRAEATPYADNSFDLITVATAYHWLDWAAFHKEALRVGRQNGVVAIWAYQLLRSEDEALNQLIHHFYKDITGPYWDPERKHVDACYATVPFDFEPLPGQQFEMQLQWDKTSLLGYFSSWSAVQHYINKQGHSPVKDILEPLEKIWQGEENKIFTFPLFLRAGRIRK